MVKVLMEYDVENVTQDEGKFIDDAAEKTNIFDGGDHVTGEHDKVWAFRDMLDQKFGDRLSTSSVHYNKGDNSESCVLVDRDGNMFKEVYRKGKYVGTVRIKGD